MAVASGSPGSALSRLNTWPTNLPGQLVAPVTFAAHGERKYSSGVMFHSPTASHGAETLFSSWINCFSLRGVAPVKPGPLSKYTTNNAMRASPFWPQWAITVSRGSPEEMLLQLMVGRRAEVRKWERLSQGAPLRALFAERPIPVAGIRTCWGAQTNG